MKQEYENNPVSGVTKQIFEQFLKKLEEEKVATDLIGRLRKTIIERGETSETVIKAAIFSDNNI